MVGHDVDATRNKPCGNHGAFATCDRRTIVDGSDHGQAGDVQLGQIQRQESPCADTVGQDPCSRPNQLCVDDAAIVAFDGLLEPNKESLYFCLFRSPEQPIAGIGGLDDHLQR